MLKSWSTVRLLAALRQTSDPLFFLVFLTNYSLIRTSLLLLSPEFHFLFNRIHRLQNILSAWEEIKFEPVKYVLCTDVFVYFEQHYLFVRMEYSYV